MDKKCATCQKLKPLEEFVKDKTQLNGVRSYCILCGRQRSLEWSQKPKSRKLRKEYNALKVKEISKYNKEYFQENKESINEYKNDRYKNNIQHKLGIVFRSRIKSALSKNVKKGKSIKLLGCSIDEYKKYLESKFTKDMNWGNYGVYWEIDHIKPCGTFNLVSAKEQRKCFHYTNTQPLTVLENRKKKKLCV